MTTFRPNVAMTMDRGQAVIISGAAVPAPGEVAVECPRCGSPYLALSESADLSDMFPGFACEAGDCGYSGSASRSQDHASV